MTSTPAHSTLPQLVYQHARQTPGRPAIHSIGQGGATWAEVWERSCRWAGWLREAGVQPGDRVADLIHQSLEANYLWVGCGVAQAVEVSINHHFKGDWLHHALAISGARVVVTSQRYLEPLLEVIEGTGIDTVLVFDGLPVEPAAMPAGVRLISGSPLEQAPLHMDHAPAGAPHDLAAVLYTSGTTGASKAVQVPWFMLQQLCRTYTSYLKTAAPVYYFPYATYHLSGRVALYCAAISGGRAVVREVFSTSSFWDDVREHGCNWTILFSAPARFLANAPARDDDRDHPLELVVVNPLLPETDALRERFGFRVFTTYGMTEVGIVMRSSLEDAVSAKAGCCGKPEEGIEARVVDEHDYTVPPGQAGELVVRSRDPWRLTTGYQGAPEATAKVMRNGWFHTGDVFRVGEDGNFYYLDRSKDMIRRRGENISSVELESAVRTHPEVAEAAAVGIKSPLGDEDVLVAVVTRSGQPIDPVALRDHLQTRVPRYAVPRFVRTMRALPYTQSTERVQRHLIREEGVTADTWDGQAVVLTSRNSRSN
ncbi:AMP-binding protein [Hydrogenophaga sp.]|uniref:AMP-binding protein n=1 Tax=Hydrogenophaga sp. TaxID=1904254 RepID=UPI00271F633B|nr:AMP-binding protein [Hydrogenophaga sp.]MDO9439053.1 AMP-binding protein [Hydrogenophaga sp.]